MLHTMSRGNKFMGEAHELVFVAKLIFGLSPEGAGRK
jgi:hypothetical protein